MVVVVGNSCESGVSQGWGDPNHAATNPTAAARPITMIAAQRSRLRRRRGLIVV